MSRNFIRQPKFHQVDPEHDMYREKRTSRATVNVPPRGEVVFNRFGTFEEKCAWMRAKQAGQIRPGRKKKR